jgi:hypothetical protein
MRCALREVRDEDLAVLFEQWADPVAAHMAAFTAPDHMDRDAFERRWTRLRADETVILISGQPTPCGKDAPFRASRLGKLIAAPPSGSKAPPQRFSEPPSVFRIPQCGGLHAQLLDGLGSCRDVMYGCGVHRLLS